MTGGYEIVLWVLLIVAAATDLLWGKIYNHLTFSFIAAGLLFRLYVGGMASASVALTAISLAFIFFFPLYFIKALAAADVKLLMAVGAWSDLKFVIHIAILSILIGALVALIVLLKRRGLRKGVEAVASQLDLRPNAEPVKPMRMPFGPAFFCSFLVLRIAELKGWSL